MGYEFGWFGKDILKLAVKTESNPYGEITKEQYKEITGEEFIVE